MSRYFWALTPKKKTLSFPQVEQARAAFIERLSPRLSPDELDSLVKDTTDFRAGRVGAAVYYRSLDTLARSKGVPLSAYPAFQEYVSYVVEAERIDVAALFEELDELEDRAFARLAVGEAGVLVQWNRDLRLAERAVQHALTPREWARYQNRAPSLAQLEARARDLGLSSAPVAELSGLLPRFAAFFEKAQARNKSLLDNLIDEARRQHGRLRRAGHRRVSCPGVGAGFDGIENFPRGSLSANGRGARIRRQLFAGVCPHAHAVGTTVVGRSALHEPSVRHLRGGSEKMDTNSMGQPWP
jgi:hypothetical protein